jgi:hypothetical protein
MIKNSAVAALLGVASATTIEEGLGQFISLQEEGDELEVAETEEPEVAESVAQIPDRHTYKAVRMLTGCLGVSDTYQVWDFRKLEQAIGIGPETPGMFAYEDSRAMRY